MKGPGREIPGKRPERTDKKSVGLWRPDRTKDSDVGAEIDVDDGIDATSDAEVEAAEFPLSRCNIVDGVDAACDDGVGVIDGTNAVAASSAGASAACAGVGRIDCFGGW